MDKPPYQLRLKLIKTASTAPKCSAKKSTSNKATNWRHKLKTENPTKYAEVLKSSSNYNKFQRLEMSIAESTLNKRHLSEEERENAEKYLEMKKKYNKSTAKRMRKMRAKKKDAQSKARRNVNKKVPPTRAQELRRKEKLAAEAKYRREKRAAMSKNQHEKYKANRREKYRQKVQTEKILEEAHLLKVREELEKEEMRLKELKEALDQREQDLKENMSAVEDHIDVRKPAARRKSLERAKSKMPQEPQKYVTTLVDLYEKASPVKQLALNKRWAKKHVKPRPCPMQPRATQTMAKSDI